MFLPVFIWWSEFWHTSWGDVYRRHADFCQVFLLTWTFRCIFCGQTKTKKKFFYCVPCQKNMNVREIFTENWNETRCLCETASPHHQGHLGLLVQGQGHRGLDLENKHAIYDYCIFYRSGFTLHTDIQTKWASYL